MNSSKQRSFRTDENGNRIATKNNVQKSSISKPMSSLAVPKSNVNYNPKVIASTSFNSGMRRQINTRASHGKTADGRRSIIGLNNKSVI